MANLQVTRRAGSVSDRSFLLLVLNHTPLFLDFLEGKVDYDYAGLTACAKKLKGLSEDFKGETQVALTANAEIPYQVVVSTIDALRKAEDGEELFPEVNFGVAK